VGDAPFFAWLEANAGAILKRDGKAITRIVQSCIKFKASVIAEDETETTGRRAVLNFGHTVAHALEAMFPDQYLHGEAVSIGLDAATRLSVARAGLEAGFAQRIASLLARFGLPVEMPKLDADELLNVLAADKKRTGAKLNFVVLTNPGHAEVMPVSLDESLVAALMGQ
jgi:3-dehydroquinate synthase